MVLRISKQGGRWHEAPFTWEEEMDFYAKTKTRPVGHCRANVCFDLLEHQRLASTARSACLLGRAERSSPEAA